MHLSQQSWQVLTISSPQSTHLRVVEQHIPGGLHHLARDAEVWG